MLDGRNGCKRRVQRGVAVPFGRGSDHSDLHRLSLFGGDPIVCARVGRAGPASATVAEPAPSASAAGQDFTGVTVELLTFNGPQIAEPLQRRAPDFEALTGAKINVVAVGFQEIYDKAILDLSTGTNSFDAFVFNPQWLGDFTGPGYLEDLTVARRERSGRRLAGRRAVLPRLQRDVRREGLHDPARRRLPHGLLPKRPDRHAAQDLGRVPDRRGGEHHGKDLNGDGEHDYGSCIAKKKGQQSFWWIISVAGGLLQAKGTGEGAFFDTANMNPLFNNEALAKALETYKKTMDYGPPDEINLGVGDTRGLFTTGRCALSMDWGDIGTLALDPRPPRSRTRSARSSRPAGTRYSIARPASSLPAMRPPARTRSMA